MFNTDPIISWHVPYDDAESFLTTASAAIDNWNTLKVFFDPVPHHPSMIIVAFDIENTDSDHQVSAFTFTNCLCKTIYNYVSTLNPTDVIIFPAATDSRYKLWQRLTSRDAATYGYSAGGEEVVNPLLKSSLLDPHYKIVTWVKNRDNNR